MHNRLSFIFWKPVLHYYQPAIVGTAARREHTAVSTKVVQLKSKKAYASIPKGTMGCDFSLLHRQVHEFSARWKAVL